MTGKRTVAIAADQIRSAGRRPNSGTRTPRAASIPSAAGRTFRKDVIVRGLVHASESHLADCRFRHLSSKTLAHYQEYEQSFIEWCAATGEPLTLPSLNATNVKVFAEYVRGRHGGKRDGEWAARSAVSTLKVWSRYLVDEDLLEADYLSRLKLPKVTKIARQAYEAWEIQALRGAMADGPTATRDVAILSLLLDTGLRISELVGLRLNDVDMNGRRLIVHWGKGRLERVVPFGNSTSRDGGSTVRKLRAYLTARYVSPDLPPKERDRVWMSIHGRPLTDVGVRLVFAKAAQRAGLSHQEVHATRHTFAVRYLVRNHNDGEGSKVEGLRYLLGHLSPDMYRVYAGQAGALIAEVAGRESVADALFNEETNGPVRLRRLMPIVQPDAGPERTTFDPTDASRRRGKEAFRRADQPSTGRRLGQ